MRRKGFTMVELLVATAVTAILGGAIVAVLKVGFDCWLYSTQKLALQKSTNALMVSLVDGGYDSDGVRDLVELKNATPTSITFVNLWHDTSHRPDPLGNKEQKFTLNRQFKVGSSVPMGQIKRFGEEEWETLPVKFYYGEGTDPQKMDDVVQFLDTIPLNAQMRIIFTPDSEVHPNAQRQLFWDTVSEKVYETYNGISKDLTSRDEATKVRNLTFIYYNNLNEPIKINSGSLTVNELKRVTGVKVYLFTTRGDEWQETTTYTNIRNVSTIGISIHAGVEVPILTSDKIKAFSLGNFFGGGTKDNTIILLTKPSLGKSWRIKLKISKTEGDSMKVDYFQMEYPPGNTVASSYNGPEFHEDEFINLMALDRTGRYDYDDDTNIDDFVNVLQGPVILKVERCDFSGAQLFLRP